MMERYNDPGATKNYDEFIVTAAEIEQKKREWVSVKDGLPEDGENVLVYTEASKHRISYKWCGFWVNVNGEHVTHWRPLPEPPLREWSMEHDVHNIKFPDPPEPAVYLETMRVTKRGLKKAYQKACSYIPKWIDKL